MNRCIQKLPAGKAWLSFSVVVLGIALGTTPSAYGQMPPTITTQPTNATPMAATTVVAGLYYSWANAVDSAGNTSPWGWGSNSNGQLADTSITSRLLPKSGLGTGLGVAGAGSLHTVGLGGYAVGGNAYGQLGNGTTTDSPTAVYDQGGICTAAGTYHTVVSGTSGQVYAWGNNNHGQLGDGTTTNQSSPVQVPNLSGVSTVSAGDIHTLALKSDGTVWAWGGNSSGQLGNGTTTESHVPVQVVGLSTIGVVSAGYTHNLALKSDGTIWAWGGNASGQLGDGTTTQRNTPIQVPGLSGVIAIAAGNAYSLAVTSDGSVWAWGNNNYGQLGDGTTTARLSPEKLTSITNVYSVAAGTSHSLAAKADGTAWAWGYNTYGELGDGTTVNETTPVRVQKINDCTFTVITGTGFTTCQWMRKPAGQSTFIPISNNATYSIVNGALQSALTIANPTPGMSGDQFLCVVSNGYGTAMSVPATLIWPNLTQGKAVIDYSHIKFMWVVPPGVQKLQFKLWGGGGTGNTGYAPYTGRGGSGGYVSALYSVVPGELINICIGGYSNSSFASAVWASSGFQMIAAGGGNGGVGDSTNGSGGDGGNGGPVGGDGQNTSYATGGKGATATAGGAGGTDSGGGYHYPSGIGPAILNGNSPAVFNNTALWSNGAAGYYSGGSAGSDLNQAGAGGGSNYIDTAHGYIAGSNVSLGSAPSIYDTAPPATTDTDYPGVLHTSVISSFFSPGPGYGAGGTANGGNRGTGAVVISYNTAPVAQTITLSPATVSLGAGESCTLTASGGVSNGSWQWTIPSGCTATNTSTNRVTVTALYAGTYTVSAQKSGDINYTTSNTATATLIATGPTVYATGGNYTIPVPSGISSINVKVWGAGGEGGAGPNGLSGVGGGGGFVSATYNVTPGQNLNVIVGLGGGSSSAAAGGSGVFIFNGFEIVAGAGGGGTGNDWGTVTATAGGAGGPAGQPGVTFSGNAVGGAGGTSSSPGVGGYGSYYSGGGGQAYGTTITTSNWTYILRNGGTQTNAAAGGGGYYGGGSGGYDGVESGGGGGGSNYVDTNPAHGYVANTAVSLGGSGSTPGNVADSCYVPGTAAGATNGFGAPGCVVITWNPTLPSSTAAPPDTSPPSTPTALNYADASATTITLIWRASTDNVGVTGYQVFRGSMLLGTTSDLTYADNNLTPSTAYTYTVKAMDAAGNVSPASTALTVSTTQDFSADSDHDGIPDATETALGTNANSAATADTTNQTQQNIHRPIQQ